MNRLGTQIPADVCQYCERPVTEQFRRVYGDNDDVAHRCLDCDSYRRLQRGSGAGVDVSVPDPQVPPGEDESGKEVAADGGVDRAQTTTGWLVLMYVLAVLAAVFFMVVIYA